MCLSSTVEIPTHLFSTVLVRAAATVGINDDKHRANLSLCKIHQKRERETPKKEMEDKIFQYEGLIDTDLTHGRRKADVKIRGEHGFLFHTSCASPSPVHEFTEIRALCSDVCLLHFRHQNRNKLNAKQQVRLLSGRGGGGALE